MYKYLYNPTIPAIFGAWLETMERLFVQKTYKLYIAGEFRASGSGRYYQLFDKKESLIANVCLGSGSDVDNAVAAACKSLVAWQAISPFNRGEILYNLAEVTEGRKQQFLELLMLQGFSREEATVEFEKTVDRIVYYAGWCDKYQQIFSCVNYVSSGHFNFSVVEPVGVVGVVAPEDSPLLGFVSSWLPAVAGGNAAVVVASQQLPLAAMVFAEAIHFSDIPKGCVNLITGHAGELIPALYKQAGLNAVVMARDYPAQNGREEAANTLTRLVDWPQQEWSGENAAGPMHIKETQELKTIWHPVQRGIANANGY